MKEKVMDALSFLNLEKEEIKNKIEIPPNKSLGDFSFPCFFLAKELKKNPIEIAKEISSKIKSKDFEKVEAIGPYINFFMNRKNSAQEIINKILKEKEKFGSSKEGNGKKIVVEFSSPNIAKPFGIGHLRSTIIGDSIARTSTFLGYKVTRINYLGDWGTQFGKLILAYKKFGNAKELKKNPIDHLQKLYVKINASDEFEDDAREEFRKLESGDKNNLKLWKQFKELSLLEFEKIYKLLNVKFDILSGESLYNKKMNSVLKGLEKNNLLIESEGAQIVNLEDKGLGVCLIRKKDGSTLYATRDIAAAIDRYEKLKFTEMLYEVGTEQKLHFKQIFKILELLGYSWANNCNHVGHGLYLGEDGKKLATRKGKTVSMSGILEETASLAREEILKREGKKPKDLDKRALSIALAAIKYGDLKNFRENDIIFDLERFISFEGDTGPYLVYSYVRAKSILGKKKFNKSKLKIKELSDSEKSLILKMSEFPEVVKSAFDAFAPNLIANYAFQLSQLFNEFYQKNQVIGSDSEEQRLAIVQSFSTVLKSCLDLLNIPTLERM